LIEKGAEKSLRKLPQSIGERLIEKILSLRENPLPSGFRKIVGSEREYRIRVGDYRVIYEIDKVKNKVIILAAGHRKNIYRDI
jgi:mRNA interferase RelE/StbE